ncbi:hypothetical protein I3843_Q044600 [Carya illinoinensis]|nr:hypothetical protein I3843_Q044600 [Carya illinoinensis]
MDDYGCAKICDFGLAKLLKPDQTRTFTSIKGTKGYVALEWHQKLPITVKADVYIQVTMLIEVEFKALIIHYRNQRLEFLGDSVLDYLITKHFYCKYPGLSPELLTDMRLASVNDDCYARSAVKWELHKDIVHASQELHKQIVETINNFEKLSSKSLGPAHMQHTHTMHGTHSHETNMQITRLGNTTIAQHTCSTAHMQQEGTRTERTSHGPTATQTCNHSDTCMGPT